MKIYWYASALLFALMSTAAYGENHWSLYKLPAIAPAQRSEEQRPAARQQFVVPFRKPPSIQDRIDRWRPRLKVADTQRYHATIILTEDEDEFLQLKIRLK
jgi:hypothetical protein